MSNAFHPAPACYRLKASVCKTNLFFSWIIQQCLWWVVPLTKYLSNLYLWKPAREKLSFMSSVNSVFMYFSLFSDSELRQLVNSWIVFSNAVKPAVSRACKVSLGGGRSFTKVISLFYAIDLHRESSIRIHMATLRLSHWKLMNQAFFSFM